MRKVLWTWVVVPLTALDWWIAWARLPERVVMKFGPDGRPSSWASRESAMTFDLVFLACVMGVLTLVAFLVAALRPDRAGRVSVATAACGVLVCLVLNGVLWAYQVP